MKEKEKIYIGHEVLSVNDFCGYSYVYGELDGCMTMQSYYVSKSFVLLKKVGENKYTYCNDENIIMSALDPNELIIDYGSKKCNDCEHFNFKGMLNCNYEAPEQEKVIGFLDVQPLSLVNADLDAARAWVYIYNSECVNEFLLVSDETYKSVIKEIDSHPFLEDMQKVKYPKKVRKRDGK